jgi:hypothetical protein
MEVFISLGCHLILFLIISVKKREAVMISKSCDIKEFIEAIKEKDYLEAIYLADKEATEAERLKFRPKAATPVKSCPRYAVSLKGFIHFMRYGIRNHSLEGSDLGTLQSIRESLPAKHVSSPDSEENPPVS